MSKSSVIRVRRSAALPRQYGYIYRSEGAADQRPHYEFDAGEGNGLVNLPMHHVIDDAMYFNFNWLGSDPSTQRITDPERVCDICGPRSASNTTSAAISTSACTCSSSAARCASRRLTG